MKRNRMTMIRSALLALTMALIFCCAAQAEAGGKCGDQVTWTLDCEGLLRIQGQGAMYDGAFWKDSVGPEHILRVRVEEGVTTIGGGAFQECAKLSEVILPESITTLGDAAFAGCDALSVMTLPSGITEMVGPAFSEKTEKLILDEMKCETAKTLGSWDIPFCLPGDDTKLIYAFTETCEPIGLTIYELPSRDVTHVDLPDGIECIREFFFEGMKQLKSVRIPSSVTKLTIGAFGGLYRHFYIQCEKGSYAEKFALEQGLQYDNGEEKVIGYDIKDPDKKIDWILRHYLRPGMSDKQKALVLHNWLINNAHYHNDQTVKCHLDETLLIKGYGVCEAYAGAYSQLLSKAGIANAKIDSNTMDHVWNVVRIGGKWYHVEVTWDDAGEQPREAPCIAGTERQKYFLMTDKQLAADHQWDTRHYSADRGWFYSWYDPEFGKELTMMLWLPKGDCLVLLDWHTKTAMVLDTAFDFTENVDIPNTCVHESLEGEKTKFKITSIAEGAFRNRKNLKSIVIAKNIQKIGKNAFLNCKNLKEITVKTTALTQKNVGDNAFKGISKKAVVHCPKDYVKAYRKLFRKRGAEKTVTFH